MKTKQLLLMLALLVVTVAGYLIFSPSEVAPGDEDNKPGAEPMKGLNFAKIRAIEITSGEGAESSTLRLEKNDDQWSVAQRDGYPADTDRIESLLKNFKAMKMLRRVPAGKSQLGRLHLNDPGAADGSATQVQFFGADDKAIHTVHLGKELSPPSGARDTSAMAGGSYPDRRFVMFDAKPSTAMVVDQVLGNATSAAVDWLNRTDFFEVENVVSLAVDYGDAAATNSWKLTRENTSTNWVLAAPREGEALDQNKITAFSQPLQSPTFSDVLVGDAANFGTNLTRITLGTLDNFTYTLTLAEPNADGEFPMQLSVAANLPENRTPDVNEKPEDKDRLNTAWQNKQQQLKIRLELHGMFTAEHWSFLIPGYTVSPFLIKRSELMGEKPSLPPIGPQPFPPIAPPPPTPANQPES